MHFDSDQPIQCKGEDRLERKDFAVSIARQIKAVPAERGFTAAITGEWGSGKSSLLNMVRETLEESDDATIVVQFNPWLFGVAEDLLPRFFSEISAQIGGTKKEALEKVARALSELEGTAAPLLPAPASTLTTLLCKLLRLATGHKSLLKERTNLQEALMKSAFRIVVIIDDMDRLDANEAKELIRLIRLMSDLPNLVFLLAYDGERLANSVAESAAAGRKYLNKIVQMEFDVPVIRQVILRKILADSLEQVTHRYQHLNLDTEEWERVLLAIVDPLMNNVRDVKRYVNSIPITLELIGKEVSLADLLGVEALRILRSSIFDILKSRGKLLTFPERESSQKLRLEQEGVDIEDELKTMLDAVGEDREILTSVLQILFPATQEYLGGMSFANNQISVWRRQRRISTEEVFQIYLHAGLDAGSVPESEIRNLVEAMSSPGQFSPLLDALTEESLNTVLDRLLDFGDGFPGQVRPEAVSALVNQFYRLSPDASGMFLMAPRSKARQVTYRLMRYFGSVGLLDSALPGIIRGIDSISGRFSLLELVAHSEDAERQLVHEEPASMIVAQIAEDLLEATAQDLAHEWNLFEMALRLGLRLDEDERNRLNAKLTEHLADDSFTVGLLRSAVNIAYLDGYPQLRLFWDGLKSLFGDKIGEAVRRLAGSSSSAAYNQNDRSTIELALKYESGWAPYTFDDE